MRTSWFSVVGPYFVRRRRAGRPHSLAFELKERSRLVVIGGGDDAVNQAATSGLRRVVTLGFLVTLSALRMSSWSRW